MTLPAKPDPIEIHLAVQHASHPISCEYFMCLVISLRSCRGYSYKVANTPQILNSETHLALGFLDEKLEICNRQLPSFLG